MIHTFIGTPIMIFQNQRGQKRVTPGLRGMVVPPFTYLAVLLFGLFFGHWFKDK